ncbi:hypothetical protein [Nocardioides immobilis]|uniref:hypothetical protein n=1 Tax=Nocardioides immobilis TaxID=2049295 RepID=UPI0011C42698|nr:hypothetical protein [Nocardioides immobilis]
MDDRVHDVRLTLPGLDDHRHVALHRGERRVHEEAGQALCRHALPAAEVSGHGGYGAVPLSEERRARLGELSRATESDLELSTNPRGGSAPLTLALGAATEDGLSRR